jgi:hypothetical protein
MKVTISILIILFCLQVKSQDFRYINSPCKPDWYVWEQKKMSKKNLIDNYQHFSGLPYKTIDQILQVKDQFHFIDFDNDGINEIIYNGFSGSEGEIIVVFQDRSNSFIESQKFWGRICNILLDTLPGCILKVYDYTCCGGYVSHLETFVYDEINDLFDLIASTANNDETVKPVDFINPIQFTVLNTPYYLRFSPKIVTRLPNGHFDFDPIEGQNILGVYKSGDTGTAYAKSIDKEGREWWYVVMDKKPDKQPYLFYEANNKTTDYKVIGWMSCRFLKIKN